MTILVHLIHITAESFRRFVGPCRPRDAGALRPAHAGSVKQRALCCDGLQTAAPFTDFSLYSAEKCAANCAPVVKEHVQEQWATMLGEQCFGTEISRTKYLKVIVS